MEDRKHERYVNPYTEQAEIARFTPDESRIYEESLKQYRDLRNVVSSAERRGRAEGRVEGRADEKADIARRLKADGMPAELIAKYTGLSAEEIDQL